MSTAIPAKPPAQPCAPAKTDGDQAAASNSAELLCRRAAQLDDRGRTDEARQLYLAALAASPDDATILNALGTLLYRTGYHSAARTTYERAIRCQPLQPAGHVNLGNLLCEAGDPAAARPYYETALRLAPGLPEAHQGLGNVLAASGETAAAERHWGLGYRNRVLNAWPYRGPGQPIHILMPVSVANGNIPARIFLDNRLFAVTTVAMEYYTPALALPPHDLVLNAIGDADLCEKALHATMDLLRRTAAPVINHPAQVLHTGRAQNASRFHDIAGVVAPRCKALPQDQLAGPNGARLLASLGFTWPVLLRAPGFHTGQHFLRVNAADELAAAVRTLPGPTVLAIDYIEATGADGKSRKGRVLIVDGELYPLHWAISAHWKVHYFTAEMADHKTYRLEEARFLADMPGFLGPLAMAALRAIADRMGLDYGGIDFGLNAHGQIVLFEANATMAIVPPPLQEKWHYRSVAIDRPLIATKSLLMKRARRKLAAAG
ncbi:MAG TPA: tetratricopeptide repeat protein [Rhodopila sp.]|nr:tetratricopeptide repeat protein [Rhodopila sp.]